jgi:hypothetical protein
LHAAPRDRGGETGEVSDDAASEGDDRVASLETRFQNSLDDGL